MVVARIKEVKSRVRLLLSAKEVPSKFQTGDPEEGYQRFYHVHIPKTGGTSLNYMFLALTGEDPAELYQSLCAAPSHRLTRNGMTYQGWNKRLINRGDYFYAFSHIPRYRLNLPRATFTFSCFRDPVKRVLSRYRELMSYRKDNVNHPSMAREGKWLGRDFDHYLKKIPKTDLVNQLFMFSARFDLDEACFRASQLSHYFFGDSFDDGVAGLNAKSGLSLAPIHVRSSEYEETIADATMAKLRTMLDEEYRFLDRLRRELPT